MAPQADQNRRAQQPAQGGRLIKQDQPLAQRGGIEPGSRAAPSDPFQQRSHHPSQAGGGIDAPERSGKIPTGSRLLPQAGQLAQQLCHKQAPIHGPVSLTWTPDSAPV